MGEVWRAYDTTIDRVVALKVLPASYADDEVYQERFRREAHAAAGLNEPHVISIYDFGEMAAQPVDSGGQHFADPARRWAVALDSGGLVFVDSDQLVTE